MKNFQILKLVIDIGSNVGLCLGMSAITFVELFKLLVDILVALLCGKTSIKPEEPKTEAKPQPADSESDDEEIKKP